jgi:ABC-type sugar transport system permease subunit
MMAEQLPAPTTEAAPTTQASPEPSADELRKRRLILGISIAIVVLLLVFLIGGTIWAIQPQNQDVTRGLRDVAIILLAFLSLVISAMSIAMLYQVTMLTLLLRDEIKPLLESVNETMNTVRGTTVFMSENVVQPTIKVASTLSGVWRTLEVLAGIRSSVQPKERKE